MFRYKIIVMQERLWRKFAFAYSEIFLQMDNEEKE